MRLNYTGNIWKLYDKVKLLHFKILSAIWLLYFVLFPLYKTQTHMSHGKKQIPTQNYCTIPCPLLCPGWSVCPWELPGEKDFLTYLLEFQMLFLNYLIHPFVFSVVQHPKGLSFNLLLCLSINSQNVKHLAAAKYQALHGTLEKTTRGSTWPRPHQQTAAHCSEMSWFSAL